jgi:hypothetical protein
MVRRQDDRHQAAAPERAPVDRRRATCRSRRSLLGRECIASNAPGQRLGCVRGRRKQARRNAQAKPHELRIPHRRSGLPAGQSDQPPLRRHRGTTSAPVPLLGDSEIENRGMEAFREYLMRGFTATTPPPMAR